MKKKKKILFVLGTIVSIVPLIAFGTSESFSINNPSTSSVTETVDSQVSKIKNKMTNAIFNYDSLEATYAENDNGLITTTEINLDYKNNRAIGVLKDEHGNPEMEFLIKNQKQLQYNYDDNNYYEAKVINEKKIKQDKRSYKINNEPAIGLSENPLAMPFGRVSIAIEPEQYVLGLMRDSETVAKGQIEFLNRTVDIIEVLLPEFLIEKSGSDKIEFYVDQNTGVILKFTQSLKGETIYHLEATSFKVNNDISHKIFEIEVPKDATQITDF